MQVLLALLAPAEQGGISGRRQATDRAAAGGGNSLRYLCCSGLVQSLARRISVASSWLSACSPCRGKRGRLREAGWLAGWRGCGLLHQAGFFQHLCLALVKTTAFAMLSFYPAGSGLIRSQTPGLPRSVLRTLTGSISPGFQWGSFPALLGDAARS